MSIEKLNQNLPNADKIEDINDMVIEVNGKVEDGKFNKNEIDNIYSILPLDREYVREYSVGHTLATYTGWTHLKAETGYSIWKYTITDYTYDQYNQLFLDNKLLTFKGEAGSESADSFGIVYLYNGSTYVDDTTEAASEGGTQFDLMDATGEYLYLGDAATFTGAKFEFHTRGSYYTLKVEYYNGAWTEMTANTNDLSENTSDFESDGYISWTVPGDWTTNSVNSQTKYWIRISTTTVPTTMAKCYYLIPYNSVPALLARSSSQLTNEEWAWCSYGTSIYVTIRNDGNSSFEGDFFITSSSSATNKQNFFISNHEYKMNYKDLNYDPVLNKAIDYVVTGNEGVISVDASAGNKLITLPTAVGIEGKRITIKTKDIVSAGNVTIDTFSSETIDGAGTLVLTIDYSVVTLISDGSNWLILNKYVP